ncbi:MAG: uroporphyrinogen-III synthase, partial [bacterium]|nr:uroporphyrinogen-III synthase [bacterium]
LEDIEARVQQENLKPPALVVVGEVVNYRNAMNWFERLPLFGKRVVITRARAQSSELVRKLESLGAEVIEFPTIQIIPPESWENLDAAIKKIDSYDWVVFTSVNGVKMFQQRLSYFNWDIRKLAKVKIAAIGPATAEQLRLIAIRADLIPEKFVAEELAALIRKQGTLKGQRFLLPRADLARSLLKDELEKSGAIVDEIVAYRTTLAAADKDKVLHELNNRKIDAITFTSSSTVSNFVDMVGKDQLNCLNGVVVACIGPITRNTAEQLGIDATITAQEYTIPVLVDEIVSYFQSINIEGKS